jgi:hypothetical protein
MPAAREAVLRMLHDARPTIVCLQETKLQLIHRFTAAEFWGPKLSAFTFLLADGIRGSILLAWDPNYVSADNLMLKEFSLSPACSSSLQQFMALPLMQTNHTS